MRTIYFKDYETAYHFGQLIPECCLINGSSTAFSGQTECIRLYNISTGETDYLLVIDEQEYYNAPLKDRQALVKF